MEKFNKMAKIELTPAWIGAIIAVVSIIASIAANYALFGYRLAQMEGRAQCADDLLSVHATTLAGNEQKLENVLASLERIEMRLDDMVTEQLCEARREGLCVNEAPGAYVHGTEEFVLKENLGLRYSYMVLVRGPH